MEKLLTKKAKDYFYNKQYKEALEIFLQQGDFYSSGLCCLLLKDTNNAKKYWLKNKNNSSASDWGLCVLDMIELKPKREPAFFQIRAFLEVYLSLFIDNDLIEYAQNLVSCCEFLEDLNPESYKFIARALFSNGYFDLAITFCKKTIDYYYCDPEAMLILSQCYFLINDISSAYEYVVKIIKMVPDYFPALLFKSILDEHKSKKQP